MEEVAGRRWLSGTARVIKIEEGQEKIYELHYKAEPVRLPGREEKLWLVVMAGFGKQRLMSLTNLMAGVRDSESLWKIEETFASSNRAITWKMCAF